MAQPTTERLDPTEVLERLRSEHESLRWEPLLPSDAVLKWRERPMGEEESLGYLHRNWLLTDKFGAGPAGGGVKQRVARRLGGLIFRAMQPYLHAERDLMANFVRMNDALAKRCDELAKAITERQLADAESQARLASLIYDSMSTTAKGP